MQSWVFVGKRGGATIIRDIVISVEAWPGSKARQFTAGSTCITNDASGNRVEWYKFVAAIVD